jgi:hypothetical protein
MSGTAFVCSGKGDKYPYIILLYHFHHCGLRVGLEF